VTPGADLTPPSNSADWFNAHATDDQAAGDLIRRAEAATRDRGQWFAVEFHNGATAYIGFTHDVEGARAEIRA
jgi:hypothetical protein